MPVVTVVVPALDEAGNLAPLIDEVMAAMPVEVIVVDNGSRDGTPAEVLATGTACLVSEPRRGYGYACAAGVAATGGADVLVFLDGDRSFSPAELPRLVAPVMAGEADLVMGSRVLGGMASGDMPPPQRFGNWLMARLVNRLYGLRLTDLGPYRAVRRSLLEKLEMREMTYGWPIEMTVKAARAGARICEVPVSYRRRTVGRSKVGGTLRGTLLAGWRIVSVTLRYARRPQKMA